MMFEKCIFIDIKAFRTKEIKYKNNLSAKYSKY